MSVLFTVVLLCFVGANARGVNISNAWFLPREKFPFFYRFFKDGATWDEAYRVCNNHGANIITPNDGDQRDVLRAYLKELDVVNHVWLGLTAEPAHFTFSWLNGEILSGDGYWLEPIPQSSQKLCAATDPASDFRWISYHCQGPEVASFVCQLRVPDWAKLDNGCMISELPSLSITLVPETGIVELISDCGLAGTRRIACKGPINRDDVIRHLSCDEDPFTDRSITEIMKESNTQHSSTSRIHKDSSSLTTKGWSWSSTERLTRHRRSVVPTTSANISDSSVVAGVAQEDSGRILLDNSGQSTVDIGGPLKMKGTSCLRLSLTPRI